MSALNKITVERNQKILLELATKPGNDICADCKTRTPRWASHNLGIFICMNCASVHRKIGTHITKVKSITMDSWTKEQVEVMKNMGNIKSNAIYNPNESRHPPPPSLMDGERDSELEQYIRSKYQYRKFIDRNALVASKLGPSRSASSLSQAKPQSSESNISSPDTRALAIRPASAAISSQPIRAGVASVPMAQARSVSQPLPSTVMRTQGPPQLQQAVNGVWEDLISLQAPSASSSLPLQYQPQQNQPQMSFQPSNSAGLAFNGYGAPMTVQPFNNLPPLNMTTNGTNPFTAMQGSPYQSFNNSNPFSQQSPFTPQFSASVSAPAFSPSSQQPSFMPNQNPMFMQSPVLQTPIAQFPNQNSQPLQMGGMSMSTPSPRPFTNTTPQIMPSTTPQFILSHTPQPTNQFMSPPPQQPQAPTSSGFPFTDQQQQQQQQQVFGMSPGTWSQPQSQYTQYNAYQAQPQQWGTM